MNPSLLVLLQSLFSFTFVVVWWWHVCIYNDVKEQMAHSAVSVYMFEHPAGLSRVGKHIELSDAHTHSFEPEGDIVYSISSFAMTHFCLSKTRLPYIFLTCSIIKPFGADSRNALQWSLFNVISLNAADTEWASVSHISMSRHTTTIPH